MADRAEELAAQFEAAHQAFLTYVEGLDDAQWLTMVPNEERTVAALVFHVAISYTTEMSSFQQMAFGGTPRAYTLDDFARLNVKMAGEAVDLERTEILDFLRESGERAAANVRALDGKQLARAGKYIATVPEQTVERWIERGLPGHINSHWASIREALENSPGLQ